MRSWRWWFGKLTGPVLFLVVGLLLIVSVGIAQRAGWLKGSTAAPVEATEEDVIYTCPMHPQIRQPVPGRCPICGMALEVPTGGGSDLDELAVQIDPAQRRLANIETAKVERGPIDATIQSVGVIAVDESRMATISSYVDGRVERLFADYTGVDVAEDDHLAVIYSPELYSAQVEYLEARKTLDKSSSAALAAVRDVQRKLVASSRQRLIELGMTNEQLAAVEEADKAESRMTIYSPIGGTVMEKLVVEGKYVEAGQAIYRIADLSTVWLMLELFPEDAARVRYGQRVSSEIQSLPGESLEGRVAFVDRTVDRAKRTVGVRVEFLNEDRRLRPGDFAKATIYLPIGQTGEVYDSDLAGRWISPMHPQIISDTPGDCPICGMKLVSTTRYGFAAEPVERPTSLYIPRSAVLMAGENSVVYVETERGRFEIRPVVLGPILRDRVVILKGLREGENVATAGNFLIDSQMQLAGKPSLIDPTRAIAAAKNRKVPLEFDHVHVMTVDGAVGAQLEELYRQYFAIQKQLASDSMPHDETPLALIELANQLSVREEFTAEVRMLLKEIVEPASEMRDAEIDEVRQSFRPISHAVVALATQVRGVNASMTFTHFFCPMVKGGAGDWLQPNAELRNPYFGSQMLTCGDAVHEFPMEGHLEEAEDDESNNGTGKE